MSKKPKFEDDEQMKNNNSTPAFQNEEQMGCAKVTLPKPTTLLDLPKELQERILLETIVLEVRDRKLLRGVWKEAGDRVAERLRNVCPQWDYVLTTDFFRNRLHGILDSFPQEFCFKILVNHHFSNCITVTALNDEVYVLRHQPHQNACIDVYARNDLQTVKRTIQLPDVTIPWNLVACSVANCLYILHQISRSIEIWRILTDEHDFQMSPWITCSPKHISRMSISADGSLVLFQGPTPSTIRVYGVDGSLQHQLELANPISYLHDVLEKSNGNFVLVMMKSLTEVDREGKTLHEYNKTSPCPPHNYCAVDLQDRIVMIDDGGYVRLLDSELNSVKVKFELELNCKGLTLFFYRVHYHRKRNEFVAFETAAFFPAGARQSLTIFNFTERSTQNVEHSE